MGNTRIKVIKSPENPKEARKMNISEKILAKASGKSTVQPGEIVDANVDVIMVHDLTGPLAIEAFKKIGISKVWNNKKVVIILDHQIPAESVKMAELHKMLRKFAKEQAIRIYDVGEGGICHQVMSEQGYVTPGSLIVGADSHTCTYGAFGSFATGIGSTEAAAVFATGKLWLKVPEAIKFNVEGKFHKYITPKDLVLSIIGKVGVDRSHIQKHRIHRRNNARYEHRGKNDRMQHGS